MSSPSSGETPLASVSPYHPSRDERAVFKLTLDVRLETDLVTGDGMLSRRVNLRTELVRFDEHHLLDPSTWNRDLKSARRRLEEKVKNLFGIERERITSQARVLHANGEWSHVIPASALKGAIRSRIELAFKPLDSVVPACFSVPDGKTVPEHTTLYRESISLRRLPCPPSNPCIVCDMMGIAGERTGGGLASRVWFSDLSLPKDSVDEEAGCVKGGTELSGWRVLAKGITPLQLGVLLWLGMGIAESGSWGSTVSMGAGRFEGMGRVRFRLTSLRKCVSWSQLLKSECEEFEFNPKTTVLESHLGKYINQEVIQI